MALEFLIKIRTQILEEKLALEQKKKNITNKLEENKRYLERLMQEKEENLDLFNPRKKVGKLQKDIQILEEKQTEYVRKDKSVEQEILTVNKKLEECEAAIKNVKEQKVQYESIIQKLKQQSEQKEESMDIISESIISESEIQKIVRAIDFCVKLISVDPMRCRLEMSSLLHQVKEIDKRMKLE